MTKKTSLKKTILRKNSLNSFQKENLIKLCSNCSICREYCPAYQISRRESKFAGGRIRILRTFIEEQFRFSQSFYENLAYCTTCKQCEIICPVEFSYVEFLERIRKVLKSDTRGLLENEAKLCSNLIENKNPYGESLKERMKWLESNKSIISKGEYAYFVGCTAAYRNNESALNTIKILSKILDKGLVLLKEDEYCCGSVYLRMGLVDICADNDILSTNLDLKKYIRHNVDTMREKNIETIIFSCSGCYKTIRKDWPKVLGEELPFKLLHIAEFLSELINKEKLTLKEFPKTITYHDPCHLGRHLGIYDEPRRVLAAIPGIELVEMEHSRENSFCCGAGGGFRSTFPDDALEIAKLRIKEAIDTKAEILVTSCIFCKNSLLKAKDGLNKSLKILNIEDLIADLIV